MCKTGHHAALDRADGVREDHRDGGGGILDRERGRRRRHDDDINVQPNHLRGKFRESIRVAFGIPALNHEIAALRVSQFPKALEHRVVKSLVSLGDKPHAPNFV